MCVSILTEGYPFGKNDPKSEEADLVSSGKQVYLILYIYIYFFINYLLVLAVHIFPRIYGEMK